MSVHENENTPPMKVISIGASDPGKVRSVNEDSILCDEATGLFILADGMGGHACGKHASLRAIEAIADYMKRWRNEDGFTWPFDPVPKRSVNENHVATALRVANVRVYNEAQRTDALGGMGTTAALILVDGETVVVGHVGDSRCYALSEDQFRQITEDHSLVNQLIRAFDLSEEEATAKAGKNVLVQSIGMDDDIVPQVCSLETKSVTTLLLCSDGLTDMLSDESIEAILKANLSDLSKASKLLIKQANQAGGNDNISVILVQFQPES